MSKFVFKKNTLLLELGGESFDIDTMLVVDAVKQIEKQAAELQESLSPDKISKEAIEKVCVALLDSLDTLLGDGAHKKIFKNRTVNFCDCLDVVHFVLKEITSFNRAKLSQYKQK